MNQIILIILMLACETASAGRYRTLSRLDKARVVISKIDYLPFGFKKDGCFARALYMGMELAIHGISSSNQYIFGNLKPNSDTKWIYHVAPLVEVGGNLRFAIFDPSFSRLPLTVKQWKRFSRPTGSAELYIAPASHYRKSQVQKASMLGKKGYSARSVFRKVKRYPKYRIAHIANACHTSWKYIGQEKFIQNKEMRNKRFRLENRTKYLIRRLKEIGILNHDSLMISCKKGSYR